MFKKIAILLTVLAIGTVSGAEIIKKTSAVQYAYSAYCNPSPSERCTPKIYELKSNVNTRYTIDTTSAIGENCSGELTCGNKTITLTGPSRMECVSDRGLKIEPYCTSACRCQLRGVITPSEPPASP